MPGDPAVRRATTLVVVVLCLLAFFEAGYGAYQRGAGEALIAVAMVVLPLLYVIPATRRCGCGTGTRCWPFRRR